MNNNLKNLIKNPLISGSVIIFSGSFLANIINFIFNLFLATRLSIVDYGIVASLISLITLPAYAANAIVPAVVQFGGKYFSENDLASVSGLYRKAGKIVLVIGVFVFIMFAVNIANISKYFMIKDFRLLIITDLIILLGFFLFLHLAMLQAKLSFGFIALMNLISALGKLMFGAIFIYVGMRTLGAISAILLSTLLPLLISFLPLRFIFIKQKIKNQINNKELLVYGLPSAIGLLALTSLITTDILLVKHFFDSELAGMYAGLSLMGRVVFYFTAPIVTVMFPLIVRKNNKNENYKGTFFLSVFLVLSASLFITLIYFLIPDFIILTFVHKKEYLVVESLLGLFAFNITIYSVLSIFVNFYFSIKKTKIFIPVLIAAIVQIIAINLNHNNLSNIINSTLSIQLVLFLILLIYFPYATKKK